MLAPSVSPKSQTHTPPHMFLEYYLVFLPFRIYGIFLSQHHAFNLVLYLFVRVVCCKSLEQETHFHFSALLFRFSLFSLQL